MSALLTIEELAAELRLPVERAKVLARRHNWPCVKFSSKSVRYSPDNLAAIIAKHRHEEKVPSAAGLPGQTARSKASA